MDLTWMDPVQLATLLREQQAQTQGPRDKGPVLVLDVRDDDFPGGNIAGAHNLPSEIWSDQVIDSFIDQKLKGTEQVVVHCMFSQQRGPRCAMRLAQRLEQQGRQGNPRVCVLRGGWQGFYRRYSSDADLLEATQDTLS